MDDEVSAAAGRLEALHERWQVWQAEDGDWWASVRRNLTPTQEQCGRVPHLRADSAAELDLLIEGEDARTWLHDRGHPFIDAITAEHARAIYERAVKDPDGDVKGDLVGGFSYVVRRQGNTVLLRAKVRPASDA